MEGTYLLLRSTFQLPDRQVEYGKLLSSGLSSTTPGKPGSFLDAAAGGGSYLMHVARGKTCVENLSVSSSGWALARFAIS